MKKVLRLALVAAFVCVCSTSYAQKFGYVNSQELIAAMPERDTVELKLNALSRELQEQLEAIQVEYNNKMQELQKNQATWTSSVRQLKERDIQSLQERFSEFQQTAQQELQTTQNQLMAPVFQKAEAAISKVGEAQGLTAVFDIASGAVAYYNKTTMKDVLADVKAELGLKK